MAVGSSVAVDIGGTFTDIVLQRGADVFVDKTLTTHDDLLRGFFRGVESVLAKAGMQPRDLDGFVVHATTIVTNALIERRGERSAMIFTRGFADTLRVRDERRYEVYDPQIEFPHPFTEADEELTIDERTLADGSVERRPDDGAIALLADEIKRRDIRSVGICFLHSYRNPANERIVGAALQRLLPSLYISLSSDVAPQIREYLRASTTSANAYAVPITRPYLSELEKRLKREAYPSKALIMISSGGVVGPETAGRLPVRMVESGPAAGALGATYIARELGEPNLLAFDMGGTTAKVCVIQRFEPLITGLFEVDRMYRLKEGSGLPLAIPCIDLIEIGAGGGSIANIGEMGLLRVGPRSAGSNPGPACYGLGGSEPTVTDADVALGLLDPDNFLGGEMVLDRSRAQAALARIGDRLGTSPVDVARGVYRIVCEAMAGAVRTHATERGVDYRGLPLLAFGGAGPVHACGVAELLNGRKVVFPPLASVLSAFGSLVTPIRLDLVRSSLVRLDDLDWDLVTGIYDDLERQGREALADAGCPVEDIRFVYSADMRYLGQQYELTVSFASRPLRDGGVALMREAFEEAYRARYSIVQREVPIEIVTWRMAAIGPAPISPDITPAGVAGSPGRRRTVHLWQPDQDVPVISRGDFLARDEAIDGPLIIEERETTLVIPPRWTARSGPLGCIVATRET